MRFTALSTLTNTHALTKVLPGQEVQLFFFKVPKDYLVFIYKIANTWHPNTALDFKVDWERVELIERENTGLEYKPPIVARHVIEVTAINKDTAEHVLEFWIDGIALNLKKV